MDEVSWNLLIICRFCRFQAGPCALQRNLRIFSIPSTDEKQKSRVKSASRPQNRARNGRVDGWASLAGCVFCQWLENRLRFIHTRFRNSAETRPICTARDSSSRFANRERVRNIQLGWDFTWRALRHGHDNWVFVTCHPKSQPLFFSIAEYIRLKQIALVLNVALIWGTISAAAMSTS